MSRNIVRILKDQWARQSLKRHYWSFLSFIGGIKSLFRKENRGFRQLVIRDWTDYFLRRRVGTTVTDPLERAHAAAAWLTRAHDATSDDGVSYGYFSCDVDGGWQTSYPETTGYIIASLIDYAVATGQDEYLDRAERMAHWEVDLQLESGAVQGGRVDTDSTPTPAAFNTGMVLHGWARLLEIRSHDRILEAARSAADFLVNDMNSAGQFRTNGEFVSEFAVKNYNSLCGWALYLLGEACDNDRYREAGERAATAAMNAQYENGWMPDNSLGRHDAVLTHTLGYTLQAFTEVGILAEREDLILAARKGIDAVIPNIRDDGFLVSWFYPDWTPALFSSCLTGSAQIAIVMYRLAGYCDEPGYVTSADKLVDFLKLRQHLETQVDGARGALPGSFPIFGQYMTRGYPNWATKYLLDALLLQAKLTRAT